MIGAAAAVAVPAGGAERLAGDEQPRPRQQPLVGRLLEAPVGAAGVAHAGEAAIEHGAHEHGGARRHQRQRHVLEPRDGDLGQHDMHVAVDQARHQRAPAAVDHVGARRLDRLGRDLLDLLALDQQLVAAAQLVVLGVEHLEVLEEILRRGRALGRLVSGSASSPCFGFTDALLIVLP